MFYIIESFGSVDFIVLLKYFLRFKREEILMNILWGSNCSDDDKILYEKFIYYFEYLYRKFNSSMIDKYEGISKKFYNMKDKYEDISEKFYRMIDKYENIIERKV